jgi:translation initiation factor 2 gamma subunit (eIF-2gamma)
MVNVGSATTEGTVVRLKEDMLSMNSDKPRLTWILARRQR